jgi:hypothetical protein
MFKSTGKQRNTEGTERTEKMLAGAASVANERRKAGAAELACRPARSEPSRSALSVSSVRSVPSVVIAHQRSRHARLTQCSDDPVSWTGQGETTAGPLQLHYTYRHTALR